VVDWIISTVFSHKFFQQKEQSMSNKVVTILEVAAKDFVKGLRIIMPYAATAGEVAVAEFAPALGPLFNQTVSAIITAEQSGAAIKGGLTSPQKLQAVVGLMGPLIAQGLADAGKANDTPAVEGYVNSVLAVLQAAPAPAAAAPAAS